MDEEEKVRVDRVIAGTPEQAWSLIKSLRSPDLGIYVIPPGEGRLGRSYIHYTFVSTINDSAKRIHAYLYISITLRADGRTRLKITSADKDWAIGAPLWLQLETELIHDGFLSESSDNSTVQLSRLGDILYKPVPGLTDRETEVAHLFALGHSSSRIATELTTSIWPP